ncbi:MAG: beta-propeller domain-containing protein [Sulfuricella sp.]|nr:beta-propeller domain-containing protein [Sulfuricella sp.]
MVAISYRISVALLGAALAGSALADNLNIALKPGWNFIGVPRDIGVQELVAASPAIGDVAAWRNGLIVNARWNNLNLGRGEGVAVYSNAATSVALPVLDLPKGKALARSDGISLQAGVNVLALPIETTVSPRIFGDRTVLTWENDAWSAYPNPAAQRYGYGNAKPFYALQPGQGFLVIGDAPLSGALSDLASQLQPFASESEMLAYLRQQALATRSFTTLPAAAPAVPAPTTAPTAPPPATASTVPPPATDCSAKTGPVPPVTPANPFVPPVTATTPSASTTSGVTNTTSTNRQEQGVDESDIVKHNGQYVFYTANRTQRILFTDFAGLAGNAKPLGEIALGGCVNVEAMYLDGDRLAVVHGSGGDYWGMWASSGPYSWNRESTVDVFDVADPAKARKIASLKLDGTVMESRMIERKLHLIVRYAPYLAVDYVKKYACVSDGTKICVPASGSYGGSYYYCYPAAQVKDQSACLVPDYDNPIVKEEKLVPYLTDNLTQQRVALFAPAKFYAPAKLDQQSNTVTVLAVDIGTGKLVDKVGISGRMDTLYMSTENLYLVSADYPRYFGWKLAADNETRSTVYRFSVGAALDFSGSAFVDGTVLNQFSLGEYQGALRIATTRRFWDQDWRSNTDNQVAVLQGAKNSLAQVGVVGGLGKAGETIRSARFLEDKGYLVTFRNTDPLYTLNLSDPKNPRKVGELAIPGYSSYLHPIDGQRLLSIGRDADSSGRTKGVLVQLFDMADFANPKLADKRLYGSDGNTGSSAENDQKAFTWRADGLLAFDLETQECSGDYTTCVKKSALKLLKVDGLAFKDNGEVQGSDTSAYWYNSDKYRGLLFDYQDKTWAAFLQGEGWKAGTVGQ